MSDSCFPERASPYPAINNKAPMPNGMAIIKGPINNLRRKPPHEDINGAGIPPHIQPIPTPDTAKNSTSRALKAPIPTSIGETDNGFISRIPLIKWVYSLPHHVEWIMFPFKGDRKI